MADELETAEPVENGHCGLGDEVPFVAGSSPALPRDLDVDAVPTGRWPLTRVRARPSEPKPGPKLALLAGARTATGEVENCIAEMAGHSPPVIPGPRTQARAAPADFPRWPVSMRLYVSTPRGPGGRHGLPDPDG